MKKQVELTDQEISVIESALNFYWNDAALKLDNNYYLMSDGSKRPLGDIEKDLLKKQKEVTLPILRKIENI